jgi:hypothetical protein
LDYLCVFTVIQISPVLADRYDQIKQATDLILKLCIAEGSENIEVVKRGNSIEIGGPNTDTLQINTRESSGLVGGISKEITALSAQQGSEARSYTENILSNYLISFLETNPVTRFDLPTQIKAT